MEKELRLWKAGAIVAMLLIAFLHR